jgi:flagellar hook-basal body complex protein FliE
MTVMNSIPSLGSPIAPAMASPGALRSPGAGGFMQVIEGLLASANGQQASADQAVRDLAIGQTDNLHGVLLEVAKADLSFRLVLEIRNRLTDAFQEIMRMQM